MPQAGLNTTTRAGPLARLITTTIVSNPDIDPDANLLYNPLNWDFVNNTHFPADFDWLEPPVKKIINGRQDAFSIECAT